MLLMASETVLLALDIFRRADCGSRDKGSESRCWGNLRVSRLGDANCRAGVYPNLEKEPAQRSRAIYKTPNCTLRCADSPKFG